ncbi:hypothetical protein [Hansschlegelia sp.]|uniref:hypothetical protein n=1 Tax=Hansschlegelia sp. TaxID=2041892 RepID=UPI002C6D9667|nr:hypothetical protein [Hansschlegelia sp.]HVI29715.1 hypothetical protein [Hansschlegelia sp.]
MVTETPPLLAGSHGSADAKDAISGTAAIAAAKINERVRGKDIGLAPAPECHNPATRESGFGCARSAAAVEFSAVSRHWNARGKTPLN